MNDSFLHITLEISYTETNIYITNKLMYFNTNEMALTYVLSFPF